MAAESKQFLEKHKRPHISNSSDQNDLEIKVTRNTCKKNTGQGKRGGNMVSSYKQLAGRRLLSLSQPSREDVFSSLISNPLPNPTQGQRPRFPCCRGYGIAASPGATNNGAAVAPGQPAINAHTRPPDSGDGARFRRKPGPETRS